MKKVYQLFCFLFLVVTSYTLYQMIFIEGEYQKEMYQAKTNTYVTSLSTPRGRILDSKGNILVDNQGVKTIVYRKINTITTEDEIEAAYSLAELLTLKKTASDLQLKRFWMVKHPEETELLITNEEYALYDQRKLNSTDLYLLKIDRITKELLSEFTDLDEKAAYIFSLMNEGYSYDAKIIKSDVTDSEYASVLESKIPGVSNEMNFVRYYPYGNTLKSIFGSVGSIPKELEEEYTALGYSLSDTIGISYLEKQYESYLKGEKDVYRVNSDGTLTQVTSGRRGNDLVLTIDIDMQLEIESILKEEIKKGKKLPNTEYYYGSYVLVGDVKNGGIKVVAGLNYIADDVFVNAERDAIYSAFTVGSVVKGADMAMAYQNGLVDVGKKVLDSCVKLYMVPSKCSYKKLGYIDDITALKTSSNYYQFLLAIKLAGYTYSYDLEMQVSEREFSIYRNAFAQFGLGARTGIDLPNENTGIKGQKIAPDLLLNLAIGQYDSYTGIELLQYINTIANRGVRYQLHLMDQIKKEDTVLVKSEPNILSTFSLDSTYFDRIEEGLRQVVQLGTGYGYTDVSFNPVGKTGTSETYYDSNQDGVGDVLTVTNTYAMYAPLQDPKYSMVVISPNVNHPNGSSDYFAYINRYISKAVSDYLFTNY